VQRPQLREGELGTYPAKNVILAGKMSFAMSTAVNTTGAQIDVVSEAHLES
jgi:hypothetical protein